MYNGIRLNNFEYFINDILKNQISVSSNDINIYKELFNLEFNIIFNNNDVFKGNAFRNIVDRTNIVIKIEHNSFKTYYFYDKNIFNLKDKNLLLNKLTEQNDKFGTILNSYLQIFSSLNNKTNIKRQIFMEVEVYVLTEDYQFKHLLEYINSINNKNLIYELQQVTINQINKLITAYGGYNTSKIQNWMPIMTPDKYAYKNSVINEQTIQCYCNIIKAIQVQQSKLLTYSFNLGGPNTTIYDLENNIDNNFLYNVLIKNKLKDYFTFYTFYYDDTHAKEYNDNKFNFNDLINIDNMLNIDEKKKYVYFTNQGISIDPNINMKDINYSKLQQCGYNEINNEFLLYQKGIYTFKNKLISCDNDRSGLIYYNTLNKNFVINESYYLYSRINNIAINYNLLQNNIIISNSSNTYNQITLYDDENKEDLIYILWTDNKDAYVTIESNYVRKYYKWNIVYDNNKIDYIKSKDNILNVQYDLTVLFESDKNFVIVVDDNMLSKANLINLQNKIRSIITYYQTTIEHLINILPESYNKEIIETNFYKLLRAAALELAEDKFTLDEIKNGFYLNALDKTEDYLKEVKEDLIYKNFGALIDLPKKAQWTYDQYRQMVTAIITVLLNGPTKNNISKAITQFTGYENYIYELYKEKDNYLFSNLGDISFTYRFAVQIFKDINKFDDAEELMNNLIFLLNLIKPAQALFLIYIIFNEKEFVNFINNVIDELTAKGTFSFKEIKFGIDMGHTFELFDKERNNENDILVGNKNTTDNILTRFPNKLGAPKYKVTDKLLIDSMFNFKEKKYKEVFDKVFFNNAVINKEIYSIQYVYDKNNNPVLDEFGNRIEKKYEELHQFTNITFKEDFNSSIFLDKHYEWHKISTAYKKNIYFPKNEMILNVTNKENLKVFLNGILISYNCYDYILYSNNDIYKNYAIGITFNNNIYKFKSTDRITIMYIYAGTYNENRNHKSDKLVVHSKMNFEDRDTLIRISGFKLLGNLPKLLPKDIYKIHPGILNNINYVVLGTLQDRSTCILRINRSIDSLTKEELKNINIMENNGVKIEYLV